MKNRLSAETIAMRVVKELQDGDYVNLGIGIPVLCSLFIPQDKEVFFHAEQGVIGYTRTLLEDDIAIADLDYVDAAGRFIPTASPGMSVFDIDTVQLIHAIKNLSSDASIIGEESINNAGPFYIGAFSDPYAEPTGMQIIQLEKKIEAGADYIITKPIFDIEGFNIWWERIKKLEIEKKINIVAGIKLLTNRENAENYSNTRPSPMIPSELLERLASGKNKESLQDKGIEIATQTVEYLSSLGGIKGFYITSDEDHDSVIKLISLINKIK